MSLTFRCSRCGKPFSVTAALAGRKVRCLDCGMVQRVPVSVSADTSSGSVRRAESSGYPLAKVPASAMRPVPDPKRAGGAAMARKPREGRWRQLVREYGAESSFLEQEILLLVALSAADLLVTYYLLRQGPSFYESNPFAQWVFHRWNIAGMTLFKFGVIGGVIVIGEVAERRRPGLGRGLMAVSCVATAAVVAYGLRLLMGFGGLGGA